MDTLVLNADGKPMSMLPPSTIQWKEAITYLWLDKVVVLEWYDDWVVSSASWETRVPAVIMLKTMLRNNRKPRFSRYNVKLRDLFTCQYCASSFEPQTLTLDHVLPISKGGKTSWTNIVSACRPCNTAKSNKLNVKPLVEPYQPDYWELVAKRKTLAFTIKHPSWTTFLQ
jgi:5-methylcytosine-specific restriction endonuclease McrA|tara:strand:+ start:13 stop:522 length:510 start_codon:yes stop_codon:yes gene_type:complete